MSTNYLILINKYEIKLVPDNENVESLEKDYTVMKYNTSLRILSYKNRNLHNIRLFSDLSNVVSLYSSDNKVKELGIITEEDIYIPIYKNYRIYNIDGEINTLTLDAYKYFIKKLKNNTISALKLNYSYDGENLKFSINYSDNINSPSSLDKHIILDNISIEKFQTLICSLEIDNIMESAKTINLLVENLNNNFKELN